MCVRAAIKSAEEVAASIPISSKLFCDSSATVVNWRGGAEEGKGGGGECVRHRFVRTKK